VHIVTVEVEINTINTVYYSSSRRYLQIGIGANGTTSAIPVTGRVYHVISNLAKVVFTVLYCTYRFERRVDS